MPENRTPRISGILKNACVLLIRQMQTFQPGLVEASAEIQNAVQTFQNAPPQLNHSCVLH